MAVVNYTISEGIGRHFLVVSWLNLATGDTGDPIMLPEWADKTVQISDTIGTSTAALEGSNDKASWDVLRAPDSTDLSFTAGLPVVKAVLENPLWVRPNVSGGAGATVDVILICTQKRAR